MGVPEVWILDPVQRIAYILRGNSITRQIDGNLRLPELGIEVALAEIFMARD